MSTVQTGPARAVTPGTVADVLGPPLLGAMHVTSVPEADWETVDSCRICGAPSAVTTVTEVRARGAVGPVLSACLDCRFVFLSRRPTEAWTARYYASDWDEKGKAKTASKVKPDRHLAQFCAPYLAPGARVLDAGAGFGKTLIAFKEAGYAVAGLEASEHRAAFVRDQLGIPCETTSLEQASFPEPFDLVLTQHVMEHVREPVAAVEAAKRLLAPGGRMLIAVPNLWREPAPQSAHYIPHHSLFTGEALSALMVRCGFAVEELSVQDELLILARLEDGASAPDAAPGDFVADLAEWVARGFGPGPRERAITWHKPRKSGLAYDGYDVGFHGGKRTIRLIGAADRARLRKDRLGRFTWRALKRFAPPEITGKAFRMLPAAVEGAGLPLILRHSGDVPPVWLK